MWNHWFLFCVRAHLKNKNRCTFGYSATKIYLVQFQRYVYHSLPRLLYRVFYIKHEVLLSRFIICRFFLLIKIAYNLKIEHVLMPNVSYERKNRYLTVNFSFILTKLKVSNTYIDNSLLLKIKHAQKKKYIYIYIRLS